MQQHFEIADFSEILPAAAIAVSHHGWRAKCLQRLVRLEFPVPQTVALSFPAVRNVSSGRGIDIGGLLAIFDDAPLISVRPSAENPQWGGPRAILNIGMNDARHAAMREEIGAVADELYARFIQSYAVDVVRLDPEPFEIPQHDHAIPEMLKNYEEETHEPFPQDQERQLEDVLRSMARAWDGTTARLLRQAQGAPADASLGLVVQQMAQGLGASESGSGVIQFVDGDTGKPQIIGQYLSQSQGREVGQDSKAALSLTKTNDGQSLEELRPETFDRLLNLGELCRTRLREEMQIEFTLEADQLHILDAGRVARSSRAEIGIAVALAEDGIIPKEDAILRVAPRAMAELLHRQIDPAAERVVAVRGIAASPGAAVGRIVFNTRDALAAASREEACILVRRETTPGDIRGMNVSVGILTERGGTTSHAAVIARGLGLPAVVGASGMRINRREKTLTTDDGRVFKEGDYITLDGSLGQVIGGALPLLEPGLDESYRTLLGWAEESADIGVRANADTVNEARIARTFNADGIGLCRTEHMFFEADRLTVMHEMIFAETPEGRAGAVERLLPMQRADFISIFETMQGRPVCIRLFDPPLHEFLPSGPEALRELAEALGRSQSQITRRVEEMREFNPMLGMRGVRLGITMPEIYDMQARAIFEATIFANQSGDSIVPEVMIPLVSAKREVELVKTRIDAVAAQVRTEMDRDFDYRLGVMVETPRAALRANEIAHHASFLSFGTNDLTQMTYGLSRDDAGRFMRVYVNEGVYPEDPFHRLDVEGVGELLTIGAERARQSRSDIVLSVCGEHGGDPESIAYCRDAGYSYVSCSPFRVPVARLAAASLTIKANRKAN